MKRSLSLLEQSKVLDFLNNPKNEIEKQRKIADFIHDSSEAMLANNNGAVYHTSVAPGVSLVLAWEDGYDTPESEKYTKDGYGINYSLRLTDSSYFVDDWYYISEVAGVTLYEHPEDSYPFESDAKWILQEIKDCHYDNPKLFFDIPGGETVDLLEDAYWVMESDSRLRDFPFELTEYWWLFHGWSDGWGCQDKLRAYAEALASYYGDFDESVQEAISWDDLITRIYNKLIEDYD